MHEPVGVDSADRYFYCGITKVEKQEDGSVLIHGRPTQEVLDIDQQIADKSWFQRALPEWFKWGNIREMHGPNAIGIGKELLWDEDGDPWITAKIVDPVAVKKTLEGVYKGLSIGIKRPEVRHDPKAAGGRIVGGDIVEISAVDRPAVPTAKFSIVKSVGGGEWWDGQTGAILPKSLNPDPSLGDSTALTAHDNRLQSAGVAGEVVEITTDAAYVRVDSQLWRVPIRQNSAGEFEIGEPEIVSADGGKGAMQMAVQTEEGKAVWSTAYVNDLPDSAFAYVAPGGKKEDRHLPYRDKDGKVDAAHVRNALARLDQTDIPEDAKAEAKRKLEAAAKEVGIEVSEEAKDEKNAKGEGGEVGGEMVYCAECREDSPFEGEGEPEALGKTGEGTLHGRCAKGHKVARHLSKTEFSEMTKEKAAAEKAAAEAAKKAATEALKAQIDELRTKLKEAEPDAKEDGEAKGAMQDNSGDPERKDEHAEDDFEKKVEKMVAERVAAALKAAGVDPEAKKRARYAKIGEALERASAAYKAAFGNDGGPADVSDPTKSGDLAEQFRSAINEVTELANALKEGEAELGYAESSRGKENMGTAERGEKPEVWNFRKDATPDSTKAAEIVTAELAKSIAAQVSEAFNPLMQRLEKVEHTAMQPPHLRAVEFPGSQVSDDTKTDKGALAMERRIRELRAAQEGLPGSQFGALLNEAVASGRRPL